jgi:hypothetical protein
MGISVSPTSLSYSRRDLRRGAPGDVRKCIAVTTTLGSHNDGSRRGEWASVFEDLSDLCREHESFQWNRRQRSVAPGVLRSSCKGENGEPHPVPHQLGWGRWVNGGFPASIFGDALMGLFLRGLARVCSFVTTVRLFAEITPRLARSVLRGPKCSLFASVGRELRRAFNR